MSMGHTKETPSWAAVPRYGAMHCSICVECIRDGEDYEAVKKRGAKVPNYYHTACIEKERAKR